MITSSKVIVLATMKNKALNLRISERRLNKLRLYSAQNDKTMTHVIEDFTDSLNIQNGDSSSTPCPVKE
ncbi:hypothetical protein NIES4074_16660 [Cylindrospermum sp. NIES-4074]|nr:hypothetical protein NIES4074_16660 [Cylindrospermum sp. NIES-4074]